MKPPLRVYYQNSQAYQQQLSQIGINQYAGYVDLVAKYSSADAQILDLGCGIGQSTKLLRERRRYVVGSDLSPKFLLSRGSVGLVAADGTALPFCDASFDLVGSMDYIEHVVDPSLALQEIVRVTRSNGVIVIVCPNLLSPFRPLTYFYRLIIWGKPTRVWGETPLHAAAQVFANLFLLLAKRGLTSVDFLCREPRVSESDMEHGGDIDASYLANPIDLTRFLEQSGCRTIPGASLHYRERGLRRALRRIASDYATPAVIVVRKTT